MRRLRENPGRPGTPLAPLQALRRPAQARQTTHWFLRLQDFSDRLRRWLEEKRHWRPSVREFALGWVREGLRPRAITRDLDWGVKVPLEGAAGKVIYVWFDAPIGYVSFTREWASGRGEEAAWKRYWQDPEAEVVHFIGKDNTPFHAVTWPAMLMGVGGYNLPAAVVANEYLNFGAGKFSKSRGNVVRLDRFCEVFGPDRLRFYLTAVAPETQDSEFTFEDFAARVNAELVNVIGNFIYRTLSFASRYFGGRAPEEAPSPAALERIASARREAEAAFSGYRFPRPWAPCWNWPATATASSTRPAPGKPAGKTPPGPPPTSPPPWNSPWRSPSSSTPSPPRPPAGCSGCSAGRPPTPRAGSTGRWAASGSSGAHWAARRYPSSAWVTRNSPRWWIPL